MYSLKTNDNQTTNWKTAFEKWKQALGAIIKLVPKTQLLWEDVSIILSTPCLQKIDNRKAML